MSFTAVAHPSRDRKPAGSSLFFSRMARPCASAIFSWRIRKQQHTNTTSAVTTASRSNCAVHEASKRDTIECIVRAVVGVTRRSTYSGDNAVDKQCKRCRNVHIN